MIGWVLIGVAVLLVLFILKFKEIRHKVGFLMILLVILFLGASAFHVYSKNDIDIQTFDGLMTMTKLYFNWLGGLFGNVKDISGYAIKQDWGTNSTLIR
jgi:TRAP-type uncharacterized transport system fused permease subunit